MTEVLWFAWTNGMNWQIITWKGSNYYLLSLLVNLGCTSKDLPETPQFLNDMNIGLILRFALCIENTCQLTILSWKVTCFQKTPFLDISFPKFWLQRYHHQDGTQGWSQVGPMRFIRIIWLKITLFIHD